MKHGDGYDRTTATVGYADTSAKVHAAMAVRDYAKTNAFVVFMLALAGALGVVNTRCTADKLSDRIDVLEAK